MSPEQWLPIAGYEGSYEVSDLGRVRSLGRVVIRGNGRTLPVRERIRKQSTHPEGYLTVALALAGGQRTHKIHALVARAFHGDPAPGLEVCHDDGICTNNAVGNLRWGTHRENVQDSVRHGTHNMASRTHCPQGHEYAGDNLYVYPDGARRHCRECGRADSRRYRARKRAA